MTMVPKDRSTGPGDRKLSTEPRSGRAWWFLGTLAVLRNPEGAPRAPAVIELTIPPGGSPPRHIHDRLDDSFLMLEGEVLICCGESTLIARAGSYVVLPAGVEHSFLVTSSVPARMLLVHGSDDFLDFIEAVGTPTRELTLPAPGAHDVDRSRLIAAAAMHDVRIVGPSLDEDSARAVTIHPGSRGSSALTALPGEQS
jgi:quercetin dioxygenase-like cupin family protein